VCLLAAKYDEVFAIVDEYTRTYSPAERDAFFGGNARRFYLGERPAPRSGG
jgi:predicted TIM-barrel fold metal-dependent hydrolase